ncbi:type II toxin-antitoxin system HicB family antitoxin [bacterium]|nr:type II toxin-antitoxin system HicB family antitoxin [bacterium]
MREYLVVIEQDEDGRYVGEVPDIKGCYSEGETLDELLGNMREAILLCLEDAEAAGGRFVGIQRVVV